MLSIVRISKRRLDKIVAIHEAGHAVAATHLGVRIEVCTIVPMRRGRLGHTTFIWPAKFTCPAFKKQGDGFRPLTTQEKSAYRWRIVEREILAMFAGFEAQLEYSSYIDAGKEAHADECDAKQLATGRWRLSGKPMPGMSAGDWPNYRSRLKKKVGTIIRIPYVRNAILFVANDLLTHKTLTEKHVRHIYAREKKHHAAHA
jgi:hypothetical protein